MCGREFGVDAEKEGGKAWWCNPVRTHTVGIPQHVLIDIPRLAFMSAFALPKGASLLDALGGNWLPWMKVAVSLRS